MNTKKTLKNKGFTIIETITYMSLLVLVGLIVTQSLINLFASYSQIRVSQDMESTAIQVIDKMSRDVRNATSIVENQSSFGIPQSYVSLLVQNELGSTDTIKYYVNNNKISVDRNGIYIGDLSASAITINNFDIRYINGTSTKALKIYLGLEAPIRDNPGVKYENFYTTVQLRD